MHRILIGLLLVTGILNARLVTVHMPTETWSFEVDSSKRLHEIIKDIEMITQQTDDMMIEIGYAHPFALQASLPANPRLTLPREYEREVTSREKSDLRYILTTLANNSLVNIMLSRSELEASGDRIEHLHPLRFLMTIFTDEELTVSIRNVRSKTWIWGQFLAGLKQSLIRESGCGNVKEVQVRHFATVVGVSPDLILPAARSQDWDLFVDQLITHVKRAGEGDRYDM